MSEYRVHRFDLRMTKDQAHLERFLNTLDGEVVSVIPNVTMKAFWVHIVNFVYVVERLPDGARDRGAGHRPA
jgi:hypothetical protein